ncbi:MAG: hypothetical protein KatS3mg076_1716 [Candidatus Binatia bacterium]|nr:MAG: hypothetical protein KatS3mg076_1716 [Candidatus Binatia bacterium]
MKRLLAFGVVAFLGAFAGDAVFRTSLWRTLRPVVVEPPEGAEAKLPVRVAWEGPRRMRVVLRYGGRKTWDLGVRRSPFRIPDSYLEERGIYHLELRSPDWPRWIRAERTFFFVPDVRRSRETRGGEVGKQLAALERSLVQLREVQEKLRDENTGLYEENAAIREENAILTEELHRLAEAERRATGRLEALEQEHRELLQAHRSLLDEVERLRLRLASVVPCSVWGYLAFPRPGTIPPTRQRVTVSNDRAEVFRTQEDCERHRRGDPGSASPCFCVGNSWAGP